MNRFSHKEFVELSSLDFKNDPILVHIMIHLKVLIIHILIELVLLPDKLSLFHKNFRIIYIFVVHKVAFQKID